MLYDLSPLVRPEIPVWAGATAYACLACGILQHGFARVRCGGCQHE